MVVSRWWAGASLAVLAVLTVLAVVLATGVDVDPLPDLPSWVYLALSLTMNAFAWWFLRRSRETSS